MRGSKNTGVPPKPAPRAAGPAGDNAMTPTRVSASVMVHFYSEVSRAELFDICATKLGDVESAVAAVRAWMAAHPELVDPSL